MIIFLFQNKNSLLTGAWLRFVYCRSKLRQGFGGAQVAKPPEAGEFSALYLKYPEVGVSSKLLLCIVFNVYVKCIFHHRHEINNKEDKEVSD